MTATLKSMRDSIVSDLDLEEDDFVNTSDINRYINEGIQSAERKIHSLYEDYFLTSAEIPITYGDQYIDYPSDIFANKVRKVIFTDNTQSNNATHVVTKVRDIALAIERDIYASDTTTPILQWQPYNSATSGRKIRIYPKNGRTGKLIVFYLRNANRLSLDADICDIDEYEEYVIRYAKTMILLKDGDPRAEDMKALEKELEQEIIDTLSDMAPTGETSVDLDLEHYDDSVGGDY